MLLVIGWAGATARIESMKWAENTRSLTEMPLEPPCTPWMIPETAAFEDSYVREP